MLMTKILLTLMLAGGAPAVQEDPLDEAAQLYQQGTIHFDSADYTSAIELFTKALGIVVAANGDDQVRLTLLYNIASAHEKQFEIDKDTSHLRQALDLYRRYRDFAREGGTIDDIFDVEDRIAKLEKRVRVADQLERNRRERTDKQDVPPPPPKGVVQDDLDWKKPRTTGAVLLGVGAAATIGGVVLAVVGSRYEPHARDEVQKLADLGVPMDHPAWKEGDQFIMQERRKGNALMGTGITFAVVGATGVGVGSYLLIKSKKMREGQVGVLPALSPGFAGVQISGSF